VKARTENPKLGDVAATYASQSTCPPSCPFLRSGCYAENGFLGGFITKRLNRGIIPTMSPADVAASEAQAIDELDGSRDLRLHVVGDSTTPAGTRLLAQSAERYSARGGHRVWTYTHAWRSVPREAWGSISVLASCESAADVGAAHALGYATAIVVESHIMDRVHKTGGMKLLPCVEQTRGKTCAECRLCMRDTELHTRVLTIAFAAHGSRQSRAKALKSLDSSVEGPAKAA